MLSPADCRRLRRQTGYAATGYAVIMMVKLTVRNAMQPRIQRVPRISLSR